MKKTIIAADLFVAPADSRSAGEPLPTVTGAHRGELALSQPAIIPFFSERNGQESRMHSVDEPLRTVTGQCRMGVAEYLVKYFGTAGAVSLDEPLDTITSRDRLALVQADVVHEVLGKVEGWRVVGWLDIRFRMLRPHELAAAMSFPAGYKFQGTREDQVKQIGNAVAVRTATALCRSILE